MRGTDLDALMATMVAGRDPLTPDFVHTLLREHYALEGELTPLTGERDQNVRVATSGGQTWVLRIAHAREPAEQSDMAPAAMLHVERSDPELPCPRVLTTRRGERLLRFTDERGAKRCAHVVSFLPGRVLAAVPRSAPQRNACGRAAGRLARALAGFDHPGAHRRLIWDVRELHCVPALLGGADVFPDAAGVLALLGELLVHLRGSLPALRRRVVHNDFNAFNVLVDEGDPDRITGVIDFGDAVHTVAVSDAAVAAAELIPDGCTDAIEARQCAEEVLQAYESEMPLTTPERCILGPLICARLLTNLVVQQWHRSRNPGGRHYADLEPDFIRARTRLSRMLLAQGTFAGA